MRAAGAEQRLVKVSQRACRRVRGKIRTKPFLFRGACFAADGILALAIQHNDVPRAEFVAVVAGLGVAGSGAKILEVRCGARGMKLMIASRRTRAGFHPAPSLVVALEVFLGAVRV